MKYVFGKCELDTLRHQLLVDGQIRSVEPQVFDVLGHFLENPDRLITHDELIEVVWGGRIVSDSAISARISAARKAIGDSGTLQRWIKTVPRRGFQFVGQVAVSDGDETVGGSNDPRSVAPRHTLKNQNIQFCHSRDGTRIAYATFGTGTPLVRAGHWLTHLEHDWSSPIWQPFLSELGSQFRVTRYDQRGNGLSNWQTEMYSLEAFTDDLEAVINAAGIEKFALYGSSQGAPIAINYAVRHPQRVSHLVLQGGFRRGRMVRGNEDEKAEAEALLTLIRQGWGKPASPFVQAVATTFIPSGTKEQIDEMTTLQKLATSPENAVAIRQAVDLFDVSEQVKKIDVPTLVIHSENDGVQSLEQGIDLAASINGAQFVMLKSDNHVILEYEAAWPELFNAIRGFISPPN